MVTNQSNPRRDQIADFCKRWNIRELSLFGSAIRDDFRPDSDVDVLVAFEEGSRARFDDWMKMREELKGIFGREVDLLSKNALRNPFRRHEILTHREVVYEARRS